MIRRELLRDSTGFARLMAKNKTISRQHPLDWFLIEDEFGRETRLKSVAKALAAEPFDAESFGKELMAKLQKLRYPQPAPSSEEITFHDILKSAGLLGVLLQAKTLRELWKSVLLRKIVEHDRELERTGRWGTGKPVGFYKRMARETYKHLEQIQEIAETYDAQELAQGLYDRVSRDFRNYVGVVIQSSRPALDRAELLAGAPRKELLSKPTNEERSSDVAIYRTLKTKLMNPRTQKKGISAIFICQLSELVSAPPDVIRLSDGDSLYRAVNRRSES